MNQELAPVLGVVALTALGVIARCDPMTSFSFHSKPDAPAVAAPCTPDGTAP